MGNPSAVAALQGGMNETISPQLQLFLMQSIKWTCSKPIKRLSTFRFRPSSLHLAPIAGGGAAQCHD